MPQEPMTLEQAKETYPAMWCVYDHPSDYPNFFVARMWYGPHATERFILSTRIEDLRNQLFKQGKTKIPRHSMDDDRIVEVWV